jgi:hypothetical protein
VFFVPGIILEFLTTTGHCVTLKSPRHSPTATLELQVCVRILFSRPSFWFAVTGLYEIYFFVFIFFIASGICNVGIWLLTQDYQAGFRCARIIGSGNVDG